MTVTVVIPCVPDASPRAGVVERVKGEPVERDPLKTEAPVKLEKVTDDSPATQPSAVTGRSKANQQVFICSVGRRRNILLCKGQFLSVARS